MNAIANQKQTLAEALLSEPAPLEAPWARDFREAARERFIDMGAPVRRDEYWRYSDPAKLTEPMPPIAPGRGDAAAAEGGPFAGLDGAEAPLRLVFVNGRFAPELSDALALDGVTIEPLSSAMAGSEDPAFGALELKGQEPVARPMAALNAALASDGAVIRVAGAAPRPVHLRYLTDGVGASYLRHKVVLAEGASLTLLESGSGGARLNVTLEVAVAPGARLDHVRAQTETGPEDQIVTAIFAELKEEAQFKSFTLVASDVEATSFVRNEAVLWLEGDGSSAHIGGGLLGARKAHADNTIFLVHDAENCESRQVFKTVLADDARGVFQGKILVKPGAQKTDGYQISQSLLLSEGAEFDAKPELEIYADDVKCSHGSTTGAVDETALFYLRARGVSKETAQAMLVAAFVDEAIDEIESEALQERMREAASDWMRRRAG